MDTVNSTHTVFLDKPPCCLEFFPQNYGYLVVGTYNLLDARDSENKRNETEDCSESVDQSAEIQRNGSLEIFELTRDIIFHADSVAVEYGVLDVHFHENLLGVATSTGLFALFKVVKSERNQAPQLQRLGIVKVADASVVVTSFAWAPTATEPRAIVTLTNGSVEIVTIPQHALERANTQSGDKVTLDSSVDQLESIESPLFKHSLEAWIVVLSPPSWNPGTRVFSGGDDAVLACSPLSAANGATPWSDRRSHTAGVTAILPLPRPFNFHIVLPSTTNTRTIYDCPILFTGGYDDKLRVMYLSNQPSPGRPTVLHELDIGGGVWRIKLISHGLSNPYQSIESSDGLQRYTYVVTLLVSAMYAGAFIVRVTFEQNVSSISPGMPTENFKVDDVVTVRSEIVSHFGEHESMCYCAESRPTPKLVEPDDSSERLMPQRQIVSCSFYDKRVCLWKVEN